MKKVLVDTNILIDFSKDKDRLLVKYLNETDKWEIWINPVIAAEFLNDKFLVDRAKLKKAKEFIGLFKCVSIDKKEGVKTGELILSGQVDYLGDGMITASCLRNNMYLLTRNVKRFKKVKRLKLLS